MKEKDMQRAFGKWLQKEGSKYFTKTSVFELKIEKTHRMLFDKVKKHQICGLASVQSGLYHKISDSPIFQGQKTRFTAPKPFDCLFLKDCDAYVVVLFYVPRKPKIIILLSLDDFLTFKKLHNKKSFTFEDFKEEFSTPLTSFLYSTYGDITKYFRPTKKKGAVKDE